MISIIIPTLNEAGSIAAAVCALRAQRPHEIIVADGGSSDATAAEASGADRIVAAPRGRASQMNAGAALASGDVLLFLHADCRLEDGALREVEQCVSRPSVPAGCMRMAVDAPGWLYRCIETAATIRTLFTGLIYGDQGLFLHRALFEKLGGFPPLHFMEDVFFSRLLRSYGRLAVTRRRIFVSARRWQRNGILRQTLRNWSLLTLATCGVHPDVLEWHYPAVR